MPKISIRTHAVIDYLAGVMLLASPFVIPYPDNLMKQIAFVFGAIILLYSSMTDYPLGLLRFVPFPIHRGADLLAGGAVWHFRPFTSQVMGRRQCFLS